MSLQSSFVEVQYCFSPEPIVTSSLQLAHLYPWHPDNPGLAYDVPDDGFNEQTSRALFGENFFKLLLLDFSFVPQGFEHGIFRRRELDPWWRGLQGQSSGWD